MIPALSALQLKWLEDRTIENRRCRVVVGHPGGCVVFSPVDWHSGIEAKSFAKFTVDRKSLAAWIANMVMPK